MPRGSAAGLSMGKLLADLFDEALSEALAASAEQIAAAGDGYRTFEARYLADKGFQGLMGGIDATTINRVANAVAEAYAHGANFQGIVDAIKSVFTDFSDDRANMVAQTVLNDAYNAGILELGKQANAGEKSWHTDGPDPCQACIENEAAGRIPISKEFPSGHQRPCGHPGCYCSLEVHAGSAGRITGAARGVRIAPT